MHIIGAYFQPLLMPDKRGFTAGITGSSVLRISSIVTQQSHTIEGYELSLIADILSDYRKYLTQDQWTFARGALATVDRPLFGWVGRFFFHNVGEEIFILLFFFEKLPARSAS